MHDTNADASIYTQSPCVAIATFDSLVVMWRDKKARVFDRRRRHFDSYISLLCATKFISNLLREGKWCERKLMALEEEVGEIVVSNRWHSDVKKRNLTLSASL